MTLDERAIAAALDDIDVVVPVDLVNRVRAGGRRRVLRRRAGAGAVVIAAGAVAVPVTLAVRHGGSTPVDPTQRQRLYPGLYAAPPDADPMQCASGFSEHASPSDYPDLLLLPPGQAVTDLAVDHDRAYCPVPHVALTAVQLTDGGDTFGVGLAVEGPNAPTVVEEGRIARGETFSGQTGHAPIDGQPAIEFTVTQDNITDAYWTELDGGQWHATVRDLPQDQAVELLNQLVIDGRAGTAKLPAATGAAWTIEPAVPDVKVLETGGLQAFWNDAQGHRVDLGVAQRPNDVVSGAVAYGGPFTLLKIRGGAASLTTGEFPRLTWQAAPDVQVLITIKGGTADELKQVAESLTLASPNDPRFGAG